MSTVPPYDESVARCFDCGHPEPVHARGCNELLIVCTDDELSYGLGGASPAESGIDPAELIAYLASK